MAICRHCGGVVKWSRPTGGYVHTAPLGQLKVSRREVDDIHQDPPRRGEPLHRQTLLHPAQPD